MMTANQDDSPDNKVIEHWGEYVKKTEGMTDQEWVDYINQRPVTVPDAARLTDQQIKTAYYVSGNFLHRRNNALQLLARAADHAWHSRDAEVAQLRQELANTKTNLESAVEDWLSELLAKRKEAIAMSDNVL